MKLNLGCGTDYREGFVNIDGSYALPRVDRHFDLSLPYWFESFPIGSVEFILANDVVEHIVHWEAMRLLKGMFLLLRPGGSVEIRVPDVEHIINSNEMSLDTKLLLLYGGQETPQGNDAAMDKSRAEYPQYFCHKYGWTRPSMEAALRLVGFQEVRSESSGFNLIAYATKPK